MNSVGIDVSKGKSMIAVMRPFGEVVVSPYEVKYTDSELSELAKLLRSLNGESRIVIESAGDYDLSMAWALYDNGFYVSVVNAMLVQSYKNNSLRKVKTGKKDSIKLANYGLDKWFELPRYVPEAETQLLLKNNLISLLDTAFPGANRLRSFQESTGDRHWPRFPAR